ncbi:MAG: ChaN family lipoprotein [Gammaproteobacteria bacterium]
MLLNIIPAVTLSAVVLAGCSPAQTDQSSLHLPIGDPARKDKQVALELDGITDTATAEVIAPEVLAERLADAGLVFVGETHTNLDFHNVQLRVIRALQEAGREVMVGLEMFPYTQQPLLDRWSNGEFTESEFVEQAEWYKYWGYHWNYYRDIFNFARENGIRMYGVNTPREVVTAVRKKGFKDLTEEEAANFPHPVKPATDEQRRMYKSFFDPDDALHMTDEAVEGMLRAQTVWDATMGWNALQALLDHGGDNAVMVVLIGSGHVTYGLGAERQTAPYYDGRIASVIPVEIRDDEGDAIEKVQASYANFIWGLPKQEAEAYPSFGVSLMGAIGDEPTKIIQVSEDSIAERAGIVVGDVLKSINGQEVDSGTTLKKIVSNWRWGDVVRVGIEHEGEAREISVPVRRLDDD